MATIALYAGKMNQMSSLLKDAKKSVSDYQSELFSLKSRTLNINRSVCDLDDVIGSVQASTQLQEQKMDSLETLSRNVENFIADVVRIDDDAAEAINQSKEEFYDKYNYLKPDCEKNIWEKICDGFASVGEWCKEHWKLIVTAVLVIVAVVIIVLSGGTAVAPFLLMIAKGTIAGAVSGGLIGGLSSLLNGGSFMDGFEEGAFSGAIGGAIFGGIGGAGQALGKGISCLSKLGEFVKDLSIISGAVSTGMAAFDLLAMADLLIGGDNNWLYDLNQRLHSSTLYNSFQIGVSVLAAFTGGMRQTMTCFVAGTMILTASGLIAIENIKAGDKVISTNPETFETAEKSVLETYVRQTDKLIHLVISGEEIITTETHPFYVSDRGFVEAGKLQIGDHLSDVCGKVLLVEEFWIEYPDEPATVYNFQVEDFHTYYVGENCIFVHNADCSIEFTNKSNLDEKEFKRQLSDQENGLNNMTVEEYLNNRALFKTKGRSPDSARYQRAARKNAISSKQFEYFTNGMPFDEAAVAAKDWAKGKAVLHGPDQIAGGTADNIVGLGDAKINSSIGAQWRSQERIDVLDEYANNLASTLTEEQLKTTFLNVELILK